MPTTEEALNFLIDRNDVIVAPSKAVNAGGVCVSGLEMSQNSQRLSWTAEEVDEKLHNAMINIHKHSVEAAEKYGSMKHGNPAVINALSVILLIVTFITVYIAQKLLEDKK